MSFGFKIPVLQVYPKGILKKASKVDKGDHLKFVYK